MISVKFNPQARMAITGDECWISVLKEAGKLRVSVLTVY